VWIIPDEVVHEVNLLMLSGKSHCWEGCLRLTRGQPLAPLLPSVALSDNRSNLDLIERIRNLSANAVYSS